MTSTPRAKAAAGRSPSPRSVKPACVLNMYHQTPAVAKTLA